MKEDGSYEAMVYGQSVHFLKDGVWADIYNSLEEKEDCYENKENDFKIKIAKKSNDDELVAITKDKYKVAWSLASSNAATDIKVENTDKDSAITEMLGSVEDDTQKENKKEELKETFSENVTSKAEYEDVYKNTDLQYIVTGKTVKENIILKEKVTDPKIDFKLKMDNLDINQEGDAVTFIDSKTKEVVFGLGKSFMYDAKGETSDEVEVKITKAEDGGYTLELIPNNEWINDEDREYPITVDPIIKTQVDDSNNILDTFVPSIDTENKYLNIFLRVGTVPGNVGIAETYIQFANLPSLGAGDMIVNANLCLLNASDYSGTAGQIDAYKITSAWNNKTVTWSTRPSVESRVLDTEGIYNGCYSWNITQAVKS